jgi:GEVED domain/Fibronectin type III domain
MKKALLNSFCLPQISKKLFTFLLIAIFSIAGLCKTFAQTVAGNYSWALSNPAAYTPITGGTALWTGSAIHYNVPSVAVANAPKPATIGFNFEYNGLTYSSCSVSKNGFLTFGAIPTTSVGNNPPISGTTGYEGAVSGFAYSGGGLVYAEFLSATYGAGLYPSEIRFETTGTAPNQVFTVQYKNLIRKASLGTGSDIGLLNFQIKLYEGTNKIETIYDIFNPTAPGTAITRSTSQQVGLRGANNLDYSNVRGGWTSGTAVNGYTGLVLSPVTLNNDSEIINSTTSYPAAVTKYTWTPCYQVRALAATALTTSVVTWTAPYVGYTGLSYDYEVRTSGAFGSGASGLIQSGNITGLTFTATGLNFGTTYNIYVRTSCGLSPAATVSINPTCGVATLPYVQDFETATVPAIPSCNSVQNVTTSPFVTNNHVVPYYGFTNKNVEVESTIGSNTWYFTQKMTFPAAGSYKLSYKYGGSRQQIFFQQKMKVFYGPNNSLTSGTMTGGIQIEDHPNIKSTNLNIVNFTVTAPGDYYIGFQGYAANQGFLLLDDIRVEPSTCLTPNTLIAQDITGTSALLTWNDPTSIPDGYVYYYSTSSTPPTNDNQIGNGYVFSGSSVTITGLTGSTNYYVWVRSICDGGDDFGAWTPMTQPVTGPYFTTLVVPNYCVLVPSVSSASYLSNFNTTGGAANINNTSGYSAGGYGNFTSQTVSQFATGTINFGTTLVGTTVGVAIWVDWNNNGTFDNTIYNSVTNPSGEKMFNTAAYVSTASGSFAVPNGQAVGSYRMRVMVDYWATSPDPCVFSTTTPPSRGEIEDYTFKCIVPPPALTLSSYTSTQCAGTSTGLVNITSPLSNYGTYTWSPAGPTGTPAGGYIFNNTVNQTYTLTASQLVSPFSINTVKYDYVAVKLPTPVVLSPVGPITTCQAGPAVLISSTGGIVGGYEIYSEDFNGPTNLFTYGVSGPNPIASPVHNSFNATFANAYWTLRPSPYTTPTAAQTISSNDNSQYYFSDSDGGGPAGSTREELISQTLNLQTYLSNPITDATLTFWHYYRSWINGSAKVEISLDGGATYLPALVTYTTITQASPTGGFVPVTISLAPYIGNNNVRIRFNYSTDYGYRWAIDNFKITASINSNVNWNLASSPVVPSAIVPGLFTDAAATTPYISGSAAASVYAMPATTTTFSASSSTIAPLVCKTSTNITVNVTPIVAGTVSSAQNICTGIAADLTLSGQSGTIAEWQWSAVSPFTVPSTNIIAGSGGSATLTSAQIGTLTADRFFRVKITNGTCITYSVPVKITISSTSWNGGPLFTNGTPDATKAVIFNNNYTSTGNLNACSVVINSGAIVTISSNNVLTVENSLNTAAGTLIFNDGASLIQNNNNANTTPIRYFRNSNLMRVYDYTYWSSPVQNQSLFNVSPGTMFDKYFYWNSTPATYDWSVILNGATTMQTGRGYIVRSPLAVGASPAIWTAPFIGIPNNGNLTTPIEVSGPLGINNLNLIGNPYPSAISANLFLTANASVIGGTIYFWTHNTPITALNYNNNDYASYNLSGGVGTAASIQPVTGGVGNNAVPNGFIGTGQAFFAEGLPSVALQPGGIVQATFTNAMRVTNNSQFYRSSVLSNNNSTTSYEKNRIWLELSNSDGAFSQMLYGNIEGATNGLDHFYDGSLFDDTPTVSIYSLLDSKKLSIKGNALPFSETDVNPIGYISKIDGSFEIKLSDFDGLFTDQNIYLEDKVTNVIHDLKSGNYNFVTLQGTFNDRFLLRFNNNTLSNIENSVKSNNVFVYKKNSDIYINSNNGKIKSISIIDAMGRLIYNNNIKSNTNEFIINNLNSSQQVVIVKVILQDGTITIKKIIL